MTKTTKRWLIIAISLILIGGLIFSGVMSVFSWDFKKLSTVDCVTKSYEITEEFKNININTITCDIEILPSDKAVVECYESEKEEHSVKVIDNTLEITVERKSKNWFIGINFDTPKITVYIPEKEYDSVTVKNTTGDVKLCDINCKSLDLKSTTGDSSLNNVIVKGKLSDSRTTGDITLKQCDASELYLKATTGDITGSLLSDKVFVTKTTTGHINVPNTLTGGKCDIKVTTGDIKIEIEQ